MFNQLRTFPALIMYHSSEKNIQDMIDSDVYRYLKWNARMKNASKYERLKYCLQNIIEFRNVFYYRIKHHNFLLRLCRHLLRPTEGVEIGGNIGGGLFISHRHAVVCPKSAGKNLRVGPGVVIGKSRGLYPQIGDNVYIASNATVIGGVNIGDNVIIGAGSVVTKDIPSDGVYAGNPARLIRHIKDVPELYEEIR